MNTLIYNGSLYINGEHTDLNDYFDNDLYLHANKASLELEGYKSPFVNNFFLSYVHNKVLPYSLLINRQEINKVKINKIDNEALYLIAASGKNEIKTDVCKIRLFFFRNKLFLFALGKLIKYYLGTIFLLFKRQLSKKQHYNPELTPVFIHTGTSYKTFKLYFKDSLNTYNFFVDTLSIRENFIAGNCIPFTTHITPLSLFSATLYVFFHSLKECILTYKELLKIFGATAMVGPFSFCTKRIPHYYLNKYAIKKIFKQNASEIIYSGEKESRWGILLDSFCKQFNKTSICVPHGLHYGLKFPHGIFGKEVICFSDKERRSLSENYRGKVIRYEAGFPERLFSYNVSKTIGAMEIVFFTEGRDHKKDECILNYLLLNYKKIYIKLHPIDNINNYQLNHENYVLLNDFFQSVSNNICIARNSTVLLEAIYNKSKSLSVLLNSKDRYYSEIMYPTLSDKGIEKLFSLKELSAKIDELLQEHSAFFYQQLT